MAERPPFVSHPRQLAVIMRKGGWEFIMAEHPKRPSRIRLRPVKQILADLNNPESSRRGRAVDDCSEFAAYSVAVLAGLLRGFNDPDEDVRLKASRGILHAFSSPDKALSKLLTDTEDAEPEVRLAATKRLLIIL